MIAKREHPDLLLSLFPGAGLLDRAFAAAGFVIVKGPDKLWDCDIRDYVGIPGRFEGIIAGPPCQGFSCANSHRKNANHPSVVNSRECLQHTLRVVNECQPTWFLIENVPACPDVRIAGYGIQRIPISDWECGGVQLRSRHVQYGDQNGWIIRPFRVNDQVQTRRKGRKPIAITTKPSSRHRTFAEQCRRQGLNQPLKLPGMTREGRFRAVGNGVPLKIGLILAEAVKFAGPSLVSDCPCGCGRTLQGKKQKSATTSCRKRLQLNRERERAHVTMKGYFPERERAGKEVCK